MDNPMMMDVDPLSAYEAQYDYIPVTMPSSHLYPHPPVSGGMVHPVLPGQGVPYTYQGEQPQNYPQNQYQHLSEATGTNYPHLAQETTHQPQLTTNELQPTTVQPQPKINELQPTTSSPNELQPTTSGANGLQPATNDANELQPTTQEEDIKPDIAALEASLNLGKKRKAKTRGRTSSYWNKKITDKDFAFYGCSLCNIPFKDIISLDKHMVIHSNRLTTYEFRMINIQKRKMLKKEMKKKKKEAKIKKETEVEIKPEEGYIGTDKATEFNGEIDNTVTTTKSNATVKKKKAKTVEDYDKNSPAYRRIMNEKKYIHAYKCFGCDKLFALSYYLRLHVRSHTGEKPYTCKECGQSFITASKMNRHMKRIHLATRHQCRICYRNFTRFELLVKHFDSRHADDKLDGEPYDYNAILPYIKELEEQLKEEKEKEKEQKLKTEDPWGLPPVIDTAGPAAVADICAKEEVFDTKKEIEISVPLNIEFVDESKEVKNFETTTVIVEEEIKEDIEIKVETDDHSVVNDHGFQDDDSEDIFKAEDQDSGEEYLPTKTWVQDHAPLIKTRKQNSVRKWEQSCHCPVCNKYISKRKNLSVHMNTHTGEKPYLCVDCDRKYSTAAALKRHKTDAHGSTKQDAECTENGKRSPKNEEDNEGKIKEDPTSDEDYFPSETWSRPPSPLPAPTKTPTRGTKVSTCPVCKKKLSSKTYLAVHMRTHTGEKPYPCYICGRGFITASKMHRHVLTHDETWEGKDIKPEDSKLKAETEIEEDSKEQLLDKAKAKIAAKKSKRAFFNKKQKKHGPWTHTCEFCNKRFLHQVTLQVHIKTHNPNETMKCYYCLEEFDNAELLKSHKDTHTLPNIYQCQLCKKDFAKKGPMMTHRKKCESKVSGGNSKNIVCEICNKKFHCVSRLKRHVTSHTMSQYTLKYECPVCAHMFHTRYHIQMHLRSHIKEGLIQEENRSAVLAMVLQNARKIPKSTADISTAPVPDPSTDERSRVCNICGEIFQHFYFLEQHLKSHANNIDLAQLEDDNDEKKHTCTVCSKSFKLPYYLKLHSFTHTKEKPFICQECGKGFITRGKLKRHLETHQGLKKFQCHICYKFFTRTSYLRIHIRTIHGPQDYGLGLPIGVCQSLPMPS